MYPYFDQVYCVTGPYSNRFQVTTTNTLQCQGEKYLCKSPVGVFLINSEVLQNDFAHTNKWKQKEQIHKPLQTGILKLAKCLWMLNVWGEERGRRGSRSHGSGRSKFPKRTKLDIDKKRKQDNFTAPFQTWYLSLTLLPLYAIGQKNIIIFIITNCLPRVQSAVSG